MKIALGSDHGGYALKCDIIQLLEKLGHDVQGLRLLLHGELRLPRLRRGGGPGRGLRRI